MCAIQAARPLSNEMVKEAVKDAQNRLGDSGRLVIRASGTEPLIRIMAECDDEAMVNSVVNEIADVVRKVAA